MKRLFSILLVVCLMLSGLALAEEPAATVEPVPMATHDFGDFTMSFPETMTWREAEEKVSGQGFFDLYPDYVEGALWNNRMSIAWDETVIDIANADPSAAADAQLANFVGNLQNSGCTVSNATVLQASLEEQDGKAVLSMIYAATVDYTGAGIDLVMDAFTLQGMCSDPAFGTYMFTIAVDDLDSAVPLMEAMASIDWAE